MSEKMDKLVQTSMEIILHAGNARNHAEEALAYAKQFDFCQAERLFAQAEEEITRAHKTQTEVIQQEAAGQEYPYSLLFVHAQDTLMTIQSELRLSREMKDLLVLLQRQSVSGHKEVLYETDSKRVS